MFQTVSYNQRDLKCKTPIAVLSLVSLICIVLSSISYFAYYEAVKVNDRYVYELTFCFPSLLSLISLILALAPNVLLILYVFKFFKEFKAAIIVPTIFACLAASPLLSIINTLIVSYSYDIILVVTNLITIITFTLATISALKGLSNKIFILIPIVFSLILSAISLISLPSVCERYARLGWTLYIFINPIKIIASITLNIALLLFGLKNRISTILTVSFKKERKSAEKMSHEEALKLLKEKLELGIISYEEYQEQRADIISKL